MTTMGNKCMHCYRNKLGLFFEGQNKINITQVFITAQLLLCIDIYIVNISILIAFNERIIFSVRILI